MDYVAVDCGYLVAWISNDEFVNSGVWTGALFLPGVH